MKRISNVFVGAFLLLMFSCSTPKEKEVTVSNAEITGFMKDYVKVVDGSYKFTNDGNSGFITVKFELIKNTDDKVCRKKHPEDVRINPIGESGDIFDTGVYGFTTSRTESAKLRDLLNTGKIGDTKSISFKWEYFGNDSSKDIAELIFKKSVSFEVLDNTFNYCSKLTESDIHWNDATEIAGSIKSSNSGSDWDKVLDEYEKFIDSYVSLLKSAKDGDNAALTESMDVLEKTESLQKELDEAKGNMSVQQANRYAKLVQKLVSAAMK